MQRIPTKVHGVIDYATGALLLAAPNLLRLRNKRSRAALRVAGGGALTYSLLTDYELGAYRKLSMPAHLALDASSGVALVAVARVARGWSNGPLDRVVPLLAGLSEIAAAVLTEPRPPARETAGDTGTSTAVSPGTGETGGGPPSGAGGDTPGGTLTDPAAPAAEEPGIPDPPAAQFSYPVADLDDEGAGTGAGRVGSLSPSAAPAPFETPGPSVPAAAGGPMSETERRELADELREDGELLGERTAGSADPLETLIEEEEEAAAAEVRMMSGSTDLNAGGDPAMEPVYEAGGGESEGFELAEADLIENATHGEGHGDPLRDAMAPEAESDLSLENVAYGEPDQEDVTEVVADPDAPDDPDDPGRGPGLAADR